MELQKIKHLSKITTTTIKAIARVMGLLAFSVDPRESETILANHSSNV